MLDTALSSSYSLELHKAFYQFPLGGDMDLTFGSKLRQDDFLGGWLRSYPVMESYLY
tara:strand:+ start:1720 stop:1890 length:171 start_codon:yes stop_codon:yes gene_type:complete